MLHLWRYMADNKVQYIVDNLVVNGEIINFAPNYYEIGKTIELIFRLLCLVTLRSILETPDR